MPKLTDAERAKLAAAIKHFEALQKRYTSTHNGTACEHVKMALIGLDRLSQEPEVVRCAECKNSSRIASDLTGRMRHCWNGRGRNNGDGFSRVHQDDYCDEGERKEGT